MRTNIVIDDAIMNEAMMLSKLKTKKAGRNKLKACVVN